jgi:hypothetical protein
VELNRGWEEYEAVNGDEHKVFAGPDVEMVAVDAES